MTSHPPGRNDPPHLWHELLTPFYAGLIVHTSRGHEPTQELRDNTEMLPLLPDSPFVESLFVELPVTTHSAPDAWVLSGETIEKMMRDANLSMHCAGAPDDDVCQSEMAVITEASTLVGPVPGHVQDLRRMVLHNAIRCIGVFLENDTSSDCPITHSPNCRRVAVPARADSPVLTKLRSDSIKSGSALEPIGNVGDGIHVLGRATGNLDPIALQCAEELTDPLGNLKAVYARGV